MPLERILGALEGKWYIRKMSNIKRRFHDQIILILSGDIKQHQAYEFMPRIVPVSGAILARQEQHKTVNLVSGKTIEDINNDLFG